MSIHVTATGRATADAELRWSQAGKAIANFSIAHNDRRKNDRGEWEDVGETCFLDVSAFGPLAEAVAESVRKGTLVTVVGQLKQRSWETRDGQKRTAYEVNAAQVATTLTRPAGGGQQGAGWSRDQQPHQQPQADPWAQTPDTNPPF